MLPEWLHKIGSFKLFAEFWGKKYLSVPVADWAIFWLNMTHAQEEVIYGIRFYCIIVTGHLQTFGLYIEVFSAYWYHVKHLIFNIVK